MTLRSTPTALAFVLLAFLVIGCGAPLQSPDTPVQGAAISGTVHGGQQPVIGAHVYLFAANTTGYGGSGIAPSTLNASVSLLNSAKTGYSDSLGAYVPTGTDGSFSITGDYTCTPDTQVYLYAVGGNPGAGTNSYDGFMAVLGNCPSADNFATLTPTLFVNEVTTVAAAYAMAGYATDATHISSSGTTLAKVGIANAFANAANLADISTGKARTSTLGNNGTVPTQTIYSIANTLAACVNSADVTSPSSGPSTACNTLITTATSLGNGNGTAAGDTATAAINIAHYPAYSIHTLYTLPNGDDAFGGGLTAQPTDFSISLTFTGGGMKYVSSVAIDAAGDAWVADFDGGLAKLNSLGEFLSPSSSEWTNSSLDAPANVVLDTSGNVWVPNEQGHTISKFNSSGVFQTTASAPDNGLIFPQFLGFDPSGNLWVASGNGTTDSLVKFTSSGTYTAAYSGNGINASSGLAIDHSGNIWLCSNSTNYVSEFSNSGGAVGSSPFTDASLNYPNSVALDSSGRLWVLNGDSATLFDSSGDVVAGYETGIAGEGLTEAVDGAGADWVVEVNVYYATLTSIPQYFFYLVAVSSTGKQLAPISGYTLNLNGNAPNNLAIDGSGNVWVGGGAQVIEFIGMATPVVTPVVANLVSPYSAPASKP